jgi:hypothetical protein
VRNIGSGIVEDGPVYVPEVNPGSSFGRCPEIRYYFSSQHIAGGAINGRRVKPYIIIVPTVATRPRLVNKAC